MNDEKTILFPNGIEIKIRYADHENMHSGYIPFKTIPEPYKTIFNNGFIGTCLLLENGDSGIYPHDLRRFLSCLKRGTWKEWKNKRGDENE